MIDRYVIRLVALPSLGGFLLLMLLVTAFNAGELLRHAVFSQFPAGHVIEMLALRDIIAAEVLLPTALYGGLLVTMTHWHRDREAFALYASGTSPSRLTRPLVLLSLLLAMVVAVVSTYGRPWAYARTYELDSAAARLSTEVMQPHQFYSWSDALVLSAAEIDSATGEMKRVFAHEKNPMGVRIIRAERGRILPPGDDRRQRVELARGTSYWVEHVSKGDRISRFERLTYLAPPEPITDPLTKRRAKTTLTLLDATLAKEIAELQWRLSFPFVAFFVILIGAELTRTLPGVSVYPRYLIGMGFYALIFNVAAMARTWVENGLVGEFPGMYWVPLGTAVLYLAIRRIPRLNLERPH